MKQIIRLTESDLHNIVRQAVNELDWRTYQSAYEKNKKPNRGWKFRDSATNAFNRQNGYGLENVPYGYTHTNDAEDSIHPKGDFYAGVNTFLQILTPLTQYQEIKIIQKYIINSI